MKKLEVVITAYNEEGRLKEVIKILQLSDKIGRIIVVDDGSLDGTYEESKKLGVDVYRHKKNQGKGNALRTGIKQVKESPFLIIDADLKNLQERHLDILISSYYSEKEKPLLVNGVLDRGIANKLTKHTDKLISGIRLMTKKVWEEVEKEEISGYEVDLLIYKKSKELGKVKTEILTDLHQHRKTEKLGFLKGAFNHLKMFISIIFNFFKIKIKKPK